MLAISQEIYLIRHTKVAVESGICYGSSEVALASTFREEAKEIQNKISWQDNSSPIFSSPLHRCLQLAEKLSQGNVIVDPRLRELDFGSMELMAWEAMDQNWLHQWMDDFVNVAAPHGESFLDLQNRAVDFWNQEILSKPDVGRMIVVTHAGIIRSLLCHLLDIPLKNAFRLDIKYGSMHKIVIQDKNPRIEFING